jgi:hypothetical protein
VLFVVRIVHVLRSPACSGRAGQPA